MPGKQLTDQQIRLYMRTRKQGHTQSTAAAKAGISERIGRRIDIGERSTQPKPKRQWSRRQDPLSDILQEVLEPLLANPELLPPCMLEYLDDN